MLVLARASVAAGILTLVSVASVGAHEGHTSCGGGAPGVIATSGGTIPTGPGQGPSKEFVTTLALSGTANEAIAVLHAGYCHQPPGPPPGPSQNRP